MQQATIRFRYTVDPEDVIRVEDIVKSTGFFNADEEEIAVELVEEQLLHGDDSGYHFIFAETDNKTVAYACYGPIDGTQCSFDLYWIVTHKHFRGRGIGRRLLAETEKAIARAGGHGIYVETASKHQYAPTRHFYESNFYKLEATLKQYYADNDDKLIYVKRV